MKKIIAATLALGGGLLLAASANAVITGSAHDFSGSGWTPGNQICVACHTPHNAMAVTDAPLWNHELSVATYTLYSTPTFDAGNDPTFQYGQPSASSKLCLSCHDGSVALENFGGTTGGTNFVTGGAVIGGGADMSDHHPVSFDYTPALATADGELWDPTTTTSNVVGGTGTIDEDMLFATQLQCASCHDVHNTSTADNSALLRKGNGGSLLCLTCHNK